MLEKLKNTLGKGGFVLSILMDLSNPFGTLEHDFMFASLVTYGFEEGAFLFMKSYLTKRQQQVRVTISLVRGKKQFLEFRNVHY